MKIKNFDTEDWISVQTAAEACGVKRQTIYYHINGPGNLMAITIDKSIFVRRSDVLAIRFRRTNRARMARTQETTC